MTALVLVSLLASSVPTLVVATSGTLDVPDVQVPQLPPAPELTVPALPEPPVVSVPQLPEAPTLTSSSSSHTATFCRITASAETVTQGGSVTLSWTTQGFATVTINGESVSSLNGNRTFTNIQENTTYTLVARTADGKSSCIATVTVLCVPPVIDTSCDLEIKKFVNRTTARPGDSLTYTISVKNIGTADCTGGGVKIFDVVHPLLIYRSHTVSNNVSAGYGTRPVYTASDRTLRFNAHTLKPGQQAHITWIGEVAKPTQCGDFTVTNQAKTTAKELNNFQDWRKSATVVTNISFPCIVPPTCPYTSADGIVIDFSGARLRSDQERARAQTTPHPVSIPAGTYELRLVAWDGYESRVNVTQPREQYRVVVRDSAGVIATSNSTPDLQDRVVSATFDGVVNESLVINRPGTQVFAEHTAFPDQTSPNSLNAICAVLIPKIVPPPKPQTITVVADKIVCDDMNQLPKFGAGGPNITSQTAANWVANNDSCRLVSGWEFEWTTNQTANPGNTFIGRAGQPWTPFGPTNANGRVSTQIDVTNVTQPIWVREVLQPGFVPFSGGTTVAEAGSAEFYCHTDVLNFDNREKIANYSANGTYYCVAWNVPVTEEPPLVPPVCDTFSATPTSIMRGQSATLAWQTSGSERVVISGGVGDVAASGTISVSPLQTTTYTLTVFGVEDQSVNCQATIQVTEPPVQAAPVCEAFTATPTQVPFGGGTTTLAWVVRDANSVSITPGVGTVSAEGTRDIFVADNTTFVLTATNGDKTTSCQTAVTVAAPPTPEPFTCADAVQFSASPATITRGQSSTLTWSTTNVDSLTISGGVSATSLSGTATVSPTNDTTYIVTANRGNQSIQCPVTVTVQTPTGGGGGGGATPRCELTASVRQVQRGEPVRLTWTSRFANDVTITDSFGITISDSKRFLANDKAPHLNGVTTLRPTQTTTYTMVAERGTRDVVCTVRVEVIDDAVIVLESRDQQPLLAGIALSNVPHTGFAAGPLLTIMFYLLLGAWAVLIAYLLVIRRTSVAGYDMATAEVSTIEPQNHYTVDPQVSVIPEGLFVERVTPPVVPPLSHLRETPDNLPVGTPTIGYAAAVAAPTAPVIDTASNSQHASDAAVTALEDHAHNQKTLLSSDAIRFLVSTTPDESTRVAVLDQVIADAKTQYPLEDGWLVINEARMRILCQACATQPVASSVAPHIPATVPTGSGSLAEAIVTGNVVAAYQMIGHRPMFALADAAADLDSVVRQRRGEEMVISELLQAETAKLTDEQLRNMIAALTGALDGTYTDEASAVKMAIMKAVKEVA